MITTTVVSGSGTPTYYIPGVPTRAALYPSMITTTVVSGSGTPTCYIPGVPTRALYPSMIATTVVPGSGTSKYRTTYYLCVMSGIPEVALGSSPTSQPSSALDCRRERKKIGSIREWIVGIMVKWSRRQTLSLRTSQSGRVASFFYRLYGSFFSDVFLLFLHFFFSFQVQIS